MGAFYANVTVRGPVSALHASKACAAVSGGWTVLVADDVEGLQAAVEWAQELTAESGSIALAVDVHDSDILTFGVVVAGEVRGSYDSYPDYFSDDEDRTPPAGLSGADLVALLGVDADPDAVDRVLRFAADVADAEDPYLFEEDRHRALVEQLGLPTAAVGAGWRYVTEEPDLFPDFAAVTS